MSRNIHLLLTLLLAYASIMLVPGVASACSCKAHFEIREAWKDQHGSVRYGEFKPDVPQEHFEAHQKRRKGETDNKCRRRAFKRAHACMSAMWRDRWLIHERRLGEAAPECSGQVTEVTAVFRPDALVAIPDLKTGLERAACCGGSPWAKDFDITREVFKRTHGGRGCGTGLRTVGSSFVSNYTFDCKAVRARENCGSIDLSSAGKEAGYDRPGMNLAGMPVEKTSPGRCRNACIRNHDCRAWSWVKPGVNGPGAQCYLKNGIPWAKKNDCCSSGTVR